MRALLRLLLILIVVVGAGYLLLGYWAGSSRSGTEVRPGSGSTGGVIDTERARERGADIAEKTAIAAARVKEGVNEASLTAKIKAKMALDDTIKARAIDVTTNDHTVTLTGTVGSTAERTRAVALARETEGVTNVIDRLEIRN